MSTIWISPAVCPWRRRKNKKARRSGLFTSEQKALQRLDVRRLQALRALLHFELDLLAFLQRLEAAHLDRGVMREQIFAALSRGDEAEALGIVEPLNSTGCHLIYFLKDAATDSGRDEAGHDDQGSD